MTGDHDLGVARDIGSLQADMRTLKHDVANMSAKIDGLSTQIGCINTQQARGFGFFAGVGFVIISVGGFLVAVAKLVFPHTG